MTMNRVFADTSFYLALMRSDDPLHGLAAAESRIARPIITTELVIVELGNACARAEDHEDYLMLVGAMRRTPRIKIVAFDTALLDRGLALMRERADKDWSLTDCTSFLVMGDHGITYALTGDKLFRQAGFVPMLT